MKLYTSTLFFLLLTNFAFGLHNEGTNNFTISIKLQGLINGTKLYLINLEKPETIDSTYVKNNLATFNGYVSNPYLARIGDQKDFFNLWIEAADIKIEVQKSNFYYAEIQGSPLNETMVKYRNLQRELKNERDSLMEYSKQLIFVEKDTGKAIKVVKVIDSLDQKTIENKIECIKDENPSYFTLNTLFSIKSKIEIAHLIKLFDQFPTNLQTSHFGKNINTYIQSETQSIAIGDKFVDLAGYDINGELHKLSDFKGQYVLLDFWASWCKPCRAQNPNLIKTYTAFNGKGFEVFGFSIDDNIESWLKAIEKDQINWTNVIDIESDFLKEESAYRRETGIPLNFLINPDGIVIAQDIKIEKLSELLQEALD
ncbi:TlpA disulfide reductase family protein [Chondrinema litorale]|uniref:TlpA disulfide reductase family protein n=1 Tax=Chondrinema litorale TaxID=2994555 RepID=UPI0025433BDA|nr:TlpA disulfide reductase family protein [Chondrinema litorale]UZR95689.1 TlpA disulfide reductase family protein [Chondrinema litorale]